MEDIEQQILQYPDLRPEEQEAVDAYVASHPRWQSLLRDVQGLERLLEEARALGAEPPEREVLAYHAVTPRSGDLPVGLREAFERVDAGLEEASLRARYESVVRRIQDLEAQSSDPADQFERLTGWALGDEGSEAGDVSEAKGSVEAKEKPPARDARRGAADRPPARPGARRFLGMPRRVAIGMAAVLLVAALYGALYLGSRLTQSKMERLAMLSDEMTSVEGYGEMRLRGRNEALIGDSTTGASYLRGLRLLRESRTTTLGLFPRYDEETLREAERLLEQVAAAEETGSFLRLEALFFLGKARLALGDREGATGALRSVIKGEGRLAPEAQAILESLYAR